MLALLAALVVAAGCTGDAPPPEATPTATATAAATATASPTPEIDLAPGLEPSRDLLARLEVLLARVSALRGVPPPELPPVRLVTVDQIGEVIAREFEADAGVTGRDPLKAEERLLRLLGLVPADYDLAEAYRDEVPEEIAGLFLPRTGEVMIRITDTWGPYEEVIVAHEFVHYLQDLAFNLTAMSTAVEGDRDRSSALSALIEGDAMVLQEQYMLEHLDLRAWLDLAEAAVGQVSRESGLPEAMMAMLLFSYMDGALFVHELRGDDDGWLEAAFERPPVSTAQILHPEKYFAGIEPRPVDLALGNLEADGWEVLDRNTLGELTLAVWLDVHGAPDAFGAVAGWAGDGYAALEHPEHGQTLVAALAWDSAADAQAFEAGLAAMPEFAAGRDGSALAARTSFGYIALESRGADEHLLVIAPTVEALQALLARTG